MRTFADDRSRSYNAIVQELRGDLNVSVMYPGTIKAFHRHGLQDDFWFLARGHVRAVLQNPLETKPQVYYMQEGSRLLIPAGVWHGVQVLGNEEAVLVYYITEKYNPDQPDEERAPWDEFYDWAISRK